ncbi:hypothetical protein Krac_9597 [Ktedonobacter racemifer DSM 44963]|uniref:Uncharacterized protein n=1 Tax=Ktedonobacter racemifer DSM 44963 TaxID=485913 RepID=D6TCS4_KTERA|nr:hypothetical protein Krac_9597 [Ktedonobacter racemifer DSM 44963]
MLPVICSWQITQRGRLQVSGVVQVERGSVGAVAVELALVCAWYGRYQPL